MQFKWISQGNGRLGLMGVGQRVFRVWFMEVPEGCAVVSVVLMVLICLSIKPLDCG